jgi:hypothetical protein
VRRTPMSRQTADPKLLALRDQLAKAEADAER